MTLDELREQALRCRECGLCEGRTNVVFGTGDPHADIMFVGEGPGRNEDEQGVPFVGAAGRLLNDLLTASGLSREEVYIANIVKCRPPQNRDPLPEEERACIHFLEKQIELVDPRIIVCLGRIAAKQLIDPDFAITRQRGQIFERNGRRIMATFHPAALLRNPANRLPTLCDFELLYRISREGTDTDV